MAEKKAVKKTTAKKPVEKKAAKAAPAEHISTKDYSKVVFYPSMTEKVVRSGEQNKIGFIVSRASDKKMIKEAIENLYGVKVSSVKTLILPDGRKRAYVQLTAEYPASELATKLGML